jgi:hypothetical protein
MYIAKLKDGPKRVKKAFSIIFEMVWWRGRKWNHMKKDFWSWSVFLLSKYWLPLLFEETLRALLFSFSFFIYAPSLEDSGGVDDIWGENEFLKNFFSNGLTWNSMMMTMDISAVDAYFRMELCMQIWLNHDYGDGGVVGILAVDAYFRVEVCTAIFLGEAGKEFFSG